MFSSIRPNWFASVMGTGIVANAAALLPFKSPVLTAIAIGFWVAAAVLLIALTAIGAGHIYRHRELALSHHRSLSVAPFYGAVSMAFLTVGSGALLAGKYVIGTGAAVWVGAGLWSIGTATGVVCAIAIPYLLFTVQRPKLSDAYGSWLMPIVPPMVAASAGAGLVPHIAAGQPRLDLLFGCFAMFGVSLLMAMIVIGIIWARLAFHGVGEARMVPTLWIVLGPLGQSITASSLLAHFVPAATSPGTVTALHDFALIYGVATWGAATAWLAIALAITIHTAREQLPFAPTWWSFTFPLGTVVTGTSELSLTAQIEAMRPLALLLFAGLLTAWLVVAVRTAALVTRRRSAQAPRSAALVAS